MSDEELMLRRLLLAGSAAIATIWALEFSHGQLQRSDAWAYPLMLCTFLGGAAALSAWRSANAWVRLSMTVTLNLYLVTNLLRTVVGVGPVPDLYQLMTGIYWLPLGYGAAFVFLSLPVALGLSALTYASITIPFLVVWRLGRLQAWPDYLPTLMINLAVAQLIYIVLLLAISRLRANYHLSRALAKELALVATTDELTGLPNRRAVSERMAQSHALAMRGVLPMSVMLIDVDHFKRINDQLGHAMGDTVLKELAQVLSSLPRLSDPVGRWGGEEFVVVAQGSSLQAAMELAERMRRTVAARAFSHGWPLSISVGVSEYQVGDSVAQWLSRADQALYAAKAAGRNRVCCAPPGQAGPAADPVAG
jgi:diguanylate cyclase (GGDEF)-like protein